MSPDEIRAEWTARRDRLDAEASQAVVIELSRRYAALDADAREVVDELLSEWVLSDDESLRFEALGLVSEHGILSALPALRELLVRLDGSTTPGAPYEQAKSRFIVARLEEDAAT